MFERSVKENIEMMKEKKMLVGMDEPFVLDREGRNNLAVYPSTSMKDLPFELKNYAMPEGLVHPRAQPLFLPESSPTENCYDDQQGEVFKWHKRKKLESI